MMLIVRRVIAMITPVMFKSRRTLKVGEQRVVSELAFLSFFQR